MISPAAAPDYLGVGFFALTGAMAVGGTSGFVVRGSALLFGLSLPQYRPRQS